MSNQGPTIGCITMSNLKQGLGVHNMWGFSPSHNILNRIHLNDEKKDSDGHDRPMNILLVKPSDPRHIIHTLAKRLKHSDGTTGTCTTSPLNIYILESEIEVLARHLLLLDIYLDSSSIRLRGEDTKLPSAIPIRHRASLYLETFNSTISKRCNDYIVQASSRLRELIFIDNDRDDCDGGRFLGKVVNFDWMKQKQLDRLEDIFKSWGGNDTTQKSCSRAEDDYCNDDIGLLRDHRLRSYYGARYDW